MKLLTLKEAANKAGLPLNTLLDLVADGRGPELHPDFRNPRRVSDENLERWIAKTERTSA